MAQGRRKEYQILLENGKSNRRYNTIDKLQIGNTIVEDKNQIRGEILDFY